MKYIASSPQTEAFAVHPGDLLVARTGATFGKTALIVEEQPAAFASFLIRITVKRDELLPAFYWHFAQGRAYWKQAETLVSRAGQPQFNANVLKRIRLPVPPIEDQQRVVETLDLLDTLVSDLSIGLPAELKARRAQYEYYRDQLLSFEEAA